MKKTVIVIIILFIPFIMNSQNNHNMTISKLIFFENGKKLYSASFDSTAILWDVESGKGLKRIDGQRGFMTCLALSEKHKILLTTARDMTIAVRNLEGKILRKITAHSDSVNYVIIRDNLAVTASDNGEIIFWQFPSMNQINKFSLKINGIDILFFSPDGKFLVAGCVDGKIRLINVIQRKVFDTVKIHNEFILSGTFINNYQLITGSSNGELSIYDINEKVIKKKIMLSGESILSLVIDNEKIYIGTKSGNIYILNISNHKILGKNKISNSGINSIAINNNKSLMAVGDDSGVIRLLSLDNMSLVKTLGN